MAAIPFYWPKM